MSSLVADTHTIVWYLSADSRLSTNALEALDNAAASSSPIYVPSICLIELTYLVEKGRLPAVARERLVRALDDSFTACDLAPLDRLVADALELVNRDQILNLPDRVIAATALALRLPLVSRDEKIKASNIRTIW